MRSKTKHRFTINQKFAAFIIISSLFVGFIGLASVYWSEYNILRQTISRDYMAMAKLLGGAIDRIITREIESTKVFMSASERLLEVNKCNLKYARMSSERKEAYFKDMDQRWIKAVDNDPLITEYTRSLVGNRLREIARDDPNVAEIFMTDKYGGLVAASGKTSDFYQADEEWWQKSFAKGKGSVFLEKIELDQSSKALSIAIAIPIKNELKEVIGVCKNSLEINRLFLPMKNFSIGRSGHVGIIDKQGNLIFHPGIQAMTEKIPDKVFKKIISQNSGFLITSEADDLHKKRVIVAYFKIDHPEIVKNSIEWWICVTQDEDEAFALMKELFFNFTLVALIMFGVVLLIGFYFSGILVRPILKLREVTDRVAKGDLNHGVEIKTNDEIEDLANSFNSMLVSLKSNFIAIDRLNDEVSLHKKTSEDLQYATEQWQRTFDSISDMVFISDKDSNIIKVNKSCSEILKLRPEEIIGKKCYGVVHSLTSHWPNCPFKQTSIDKKMHVEEVEELRLGRILLVTVSPIFKDNGEFIGGIHIAKDITQIKKYQHELEKKNKDLEKLDKLKSEFVSVVSHELRTPLSIIKEGISLVIDQIPGEINQKQDKILKTSKDNIDRLARIINNLLDISKIESGRIELKKKIIDINSLVRKVVTNFDLKGKERGIQLKLNLSQSELSISIDEDRIFDVLTNLINNALKFTEKGYVQIEVVDQGNQIQCIVSDSGIGIHKENLDKLFTKFVQFDRIDGGGEKGTGLGLSIAKGFVELHGGKIWAKSEFEKGTQIYFTLPK